MKTCGKWNPRLARFAKDKHQLKSCSLQPSLLGDRREMITWKSHTWQKSRILQTGLVACSRLKFSRLPLQEAKD